MWKPDMLMHWRIEWNVSHLLDLKVSNVAGNWPRRWNGLRGRRQSWPREGSASQSSTQTQVFPTRSVASCDTWGFKSSNQNQVFPAKITSEGLTESLASFQEAPTKLFSSTFPSALSPKKNCRNMWWWFLMNKSVYCMVRATTMQLWYSLNTLCDTSSGSSNQSDILSNHIVAAFAIFYT